MGRPKKNLDQVIVDQWHARNGADVRDIGTADTTQWFFHCLCNRHITMRTMQAVVKNINTLECGVCNPQKKLQPPSHWECLAYTALHTLGYTDFMTEVKILKGKFSAADIVVIVSDTLWVVVMVDGEHHFRTTRDSRTHKEQQETDDRFDCRAMAQQFSVIRLHFRDAWCFEYQLRVFLQQCTVSGQPLLLKSPSYYALT
jgi:transcription elongation factor Elf1